MGGSIEQVTCLTAGQWQATGYLEHRYSDWQLLEGNEKCLKQQDEERERRWVGAI